MILLILKIIFLFITVLFTLSNGAKLYYKARISVDQFIAWAIGITGFIVCQWLI